MILLERAGHRRRVCSEPYLRLYGQGGQERQGGQGRQGSGSARRRDGRERQKRPTVPTVEFMRLARCPRSSTATASTPPISWRSPTASGPVTTTRPARRQPSCERSTSARGMGRASSAPYGC